MPLAEAQTFFNQEGQASVIEVYVDDPDDMDAVRRKIEPAQQRPMIDTDWRQLNRSFLRTGGREQRDVRHSRADRARGRAQHHLGPHHAGAGQGARGGDLRTMGATRGAIMRIFLITGATIGFVGTAVGLALGLLVAHNVEPIRQGLSRITGANLFPSEFYFLSQLPSRVETSNVVAVVAMALILSLAATIIRLGVPPA